MKLIDIEENKIYKQLGFDAYFRYNIHGEIECNSYPDDWQYSIKLTNIKALLKIEVVEFGPLKWEFEKFSEDLKIVLKQADNTVRLSLKELEKLYEDVANEKNAPF